MHEKLKIKALRKLILPVLAILFLYFGFMTVYTFAYPATTPAGRNTLLQQKIEYDYQVYPKESILYPAETEWLPSGNESYFSALTKKITVQVTGEIIAGEGGTAEGDFRLNLWLRSPGRWEKELPFEPDISSARTENNTLTYNANFDLPLQEATALAEAIIEEVQVRPREGLVLVISSMLEPTAAGADHTAPVTPLQAEFLFIIDGPLIIPQGNQMFKEATFASPAGEAPQYVRFFGLPVTVSAGKLLFPSLALLVAMASGSYYMEAVKNNVHPAKNKQPRELEKIRKKLGGRLVRADVIRDTGSIFKVEVREYKELARLADELEKPVIEVVSQKDTDNAMAGYFVLDGETMYFYRLKYGHSDKIASPVARHELKQNHGGSQAARPS